MSDLWNDENSIHDEIMVLQSIYEDRLEVKQSESDITLSIMLYPATADDSNSQFVKLLLELVVSEQYPSTAVMVNFKVSRGLSDKQLQNIKKKLNDHIQQSYDGSVLFDLIEMAKDSLTSNNIPSCPCPVCLNSFQEYDDFLKTECFHYLHSYCMYEYIQHYMTEEKESNELSGNHLKKVKERRLKTIPCPVCREQVSFNIETLSNSTPPVESRQPAEFDFSEIKQEVKRMEKIFRRQKEMGGIIDLDAEKNKYLLSSIAEAYANRTTSSASEVQDTERQNSHDHAEESRKDGPRTHDKHTGRRTNYYCHKPHRYADRPKKSHQTREESNGNNRSSDPVDNRGTKPHYPFQGKPTGHCHSAPPHRYHNQKRYYEPQKKSYHSHRTFGNNNATRTHETRKSTSSRRKSAGAVDQSTSSKATEKCL